MGKSQSLKPQFPFQKFIAYIGTYNSLGAALHCNSVTDSNHAKVLGTHQNTKPVPATCKPGMRRVNVPASSRGKTNRKLEA